MYTLLAMKMMMLFTSYITIAIAHIYYMVVYYCFTEMHLCPILVLVDEIVTPHFVLDSRRMCQFVSLCKAHLCISGVKLCYLFVIICAISKRFLFCIVTGVT